MSKASSTDMSSDITIDWFDIQAAPRAQADKTSVLFKYENITGTLDGVVTVYVSNDNDSTVNTQLLAGTFAVDTDNKVDELYLTMPYAKMKIVYTANSITAGTLRADLCNIIYKENRSN